MPLLTVILILSCSLMYSVSGHAKGVYQQPADFIRQNFDSQPPKPEVLWLNDDLRRQVEDILQHKYSGARIRYWRDAQRSAWILEEVGKTRAITTGIVIKHDKIETIRVLVFRESRGWEVRHRFFTDQFIDAGIESDNRLDRSIDGISGATLSVRAVTKLARIALLLNKHIEP